MKRTVKLTTLAMLSALAFITYLAVPKISFIPALPFLHYDPKDVIIVMGGFLFGPLSALVMSVVVSFVELVTVSSTGYIGFIMNVLSSCAFACTAAIIYKSRHGFVWMAISLLSGVLAMSAVMLLWNYLIVPLYMSAPREQIVKLLIPGFLPFNLFKGGLNAGLAMLIFTPLKAALSKTNLLPVNPNLLQSNPNLLQGNPNLLQGNPNLLQGNPNLMQVNPNENRTKNNIGAVLVGLFIVATFVLLILVFRGDI